MPTTPPATSPTARVRRAVRHARRKVLRHRRGLAALCAAGAVAAGLQATAAPPPPSVAVTVAARDLAPGRVLSTDDLTTVPLPPDAVPEGVVTDPVGRTLAAGATRGQPVTEPVLLGATVGGEALGAGGRVAVPLRLPDPGMVALLSVGDTVDLVATDPQAGTGSVVASGVPVLGVPPADEGAAVAGGGPGGRVVVVGLLEGEVAEVSAAAVRSFLTYAWSR